MLRKIFFLLIVYALSLNVYSNDNDVLIIERSLENQTILFISNLSDESKGISHDINGDYRNLMSGEITNFNSMEKLNFKSWDYLLLEKL